MLVHHRATPGIKVAGTHLDTLVLKNTTQMSQARDGIQTSLSGVERTNHEAPAPSHKKQMR